MDTPPKYITQSGAVAITGKSASTIARLVKSHANTKINGHAAIIAAKRGKRRKYGILPELIEQEYQTTIHPDMVVIHKFVKSSPPNTTKSSPSSPPPDTGLAAHLKNENKRLHTVITELKAKADTMEERHHREKLELMDTIRKMADANREILKELQRLAAPPPDALLAEPEPPVDPDAPQAATPPSSSTTLIWMAVIGLAIIVAMVAVVKIFGGL